ncbi:MAG TPA: ATP-binding protein [Pyrinomonadaceae bacterium]|jgi:PAS domain S-box-containing protein|nr:ATP-binding protein [Pyrinomonadaceae bacterium]
MKKSSTLRLNLFFIAFTVLVTTIVIFTWEQVLRTPVFTWIDAHYLSNAAERWNLEQRIEHYFISTMVDIVVITILLRLFNSQQRKLRASEERYRSLFEHAVAGIAVLTASDHKLLEVNNKFGAMLGYRRQQVIGKDIRELGWGISEGSTPEELVKALNGSLAEKRELTIQTAAGVRLPVAASSNTISTEKERLIIIFIHDISRRKQLEAEKDEMQRQLFQSSKLASIGELSAGVAHEINNPLNGIINFAQLLKDDEVARTETQRMMLDRIISEGERIAEIVRSLLTFARQDAPKSTRVNLAETIASSLALFGHQLDKDGITVSIELPVKMPLVWADSSRLRQVMVNMISNAHHALKAKSSGKKVLRISGRAVVEGDERKVCLEFFDSGTGMDQKIIDKVFDPFFTTKRLDGGTGLGLSLSFGIIRAYGGNITVESEKGSYTRFRMELPAVGSHETVEFESLAV